MAPRRGRRRPRRIRGLDSQISREASIEAHSIFCSFPNPIPVMGKRADIPPRRCRRLLLTHHGTSVVGIWPVRRINQRATLCAGRSPESKWHPCGRWCSGSRTAHPIPSPDRQRDRLFSAVSNALMVGHRIRCLWFGSVATRVSHLRNSRAHSFPPTRRNGRALLFVPITPDSHQRSTRTTCEARKTGDASS